MERRNDSLDLLACLVLAALALLPLTTCAYNEGFIENKGQIHDQHRKPNPAVKFLLNRAGMNVQLRSDGFSYDTYQIPHPRPLSEGEGRKADPDHRIHEVELDRPTTDATSATYQFHRIDLRFANGNPNAEMIAEGESEDYLNYYTDVTGEGGATFVGHYSTVTYAEVWPNIDVRCIAGEEGFKYDVIVRPGGDISDVRFNVEGAGISESLKGRLVFSWSDGSMEELIPESWMENGRKKSPVEVRYSIREDGTFGFIAEERIEGTLVIDPTIQWATYYGGSGNEGYASAAMDNAGNAYIAGETTSTNNIATSGTHDATYNGNVDGFIAKLTPAGIRVWGTYFGGASSEGWGNIHVNDAGLAVVSGYTFSTSGIASVGAHKTQLTGTSDAFLMLFNANGTRQWGTYYGGGALDRGNDASMAMNGRVALVGQTNSPSGIASRGAPDVSLGGGMDGFVAWFSPTGARLFGSYIGGSGDDWATGVAAGFANSEFVVSGTTMSASGIATAGSHDASYNGLHDAFMALYNGSGTGTKTWSTYYGGTGYDFGMGVTWLSTNTFAMCGKTSSTIGIATAGCDQPAYSGGTTDGFHVAFDRFTKARLFGSYVGGSDEDHMMRIVKLGNQGYAIASQWMSAGQATPGSFGPVGPGPYVAGYTSSGVKNWAGYMPDHDLFTIGLGANSTSAVVVGANELGDATTTPGVHQPVSGGGWDLIVHRLVNTTPPVLMPLQDNPVSALKNLNIMTDGATLLLQCDGRQDVFNSATITVTDALGRAVPFTATVTSGSSARIELASGSGVFIVAVTRPDGDRSAVRVHLP
ncbi:MAG: hypothetical protein IPJ76_15715 [Flavobacteriales bacterium]|nr:MAG: hypothetical protein IPJ76_15715 [Flavobacteriales bacterium]